MSRSARLVVRVVLVPAGPCAADARRRVAEVLLRAARSATPADAPAPINGATAAPDPSGLHMADP